MFANLASQKDRDAKPNKGKRKYLPGSERLAEDENAERHDKNRRQILDKTQNAQRQTHGTDDKRMAPIVKATRGTAAITPVATKAAASPGSAVGEKCEAPIAVK